MVKMKKVTEVGIKELKDQASAIIERVMKTGRSVVITKNGKPVAQISQIVESSSEDVVQRWVDLGLLSRRGGGDVSRVELVTPKEGRVAVVGDGMEGVRAIIADRESGA